MFKACKLTLTCLHEPFFGRARNARRSSLNASGFLAEFAVAVADCVPVICFFDSLFHVVLFSCASLKR